MRDAIDESKHASSTFRPDFHPIEQHLTKLKALLHSAATRIIQGLWVAISVAHARFKAAECRN